MFTLESEFSGSNGKTRARLVVRDGERRIVHSDTIGISSARSRKQFLKAVAAQLSDPTDRKELERQLLDLADHPPAPEDQVGDVPQSGLRWEVAGPDELVFDPKDPLPIARSFLREYFAHADGAKLWLSGGDFHDWDGCKYVATETAGLRSRIYHYLERAKKFVRVGDVMQLIDFAPTRSAVDNVVDALMAEAYVKASPPCWIGGGIDAPPAAELIATPGGIVHLRRDGKPLRFRPPTPRFFSHNALDFNYDADAPDPAAWLRFLTRLWPNDSDAIDLLQEWFGYVLTLDTRQQKILLLVGPPRSGKGTIARVLTKLVGPANVCGPTLAGLATNFGLMSLINAQLAIISDARLSGRSDQAVVVERLLAVSGEDSITVDRKNQTPVTLKLATRLMVLSNELPRLTDASGAMANRFVVLTLAESHLGREDTGLTERLYAEMPGILLWAIEGWKRLMGRGHFVQPGSSEEAIEEMTDLASPVSAFLREWCVVRVGLSVPVKDVFEAWGGWCKQQGQQHSGTAQTFGRDLRAAHPGVSCGQRRRDLGVQREYQGLDLTSHAKAELQHARATKSGWPGPEYG